MINLAEDANRRVRADASKQMAQDEMAHEGKATKLKEDITTLKKSLQEMVASNREKEQELRKVSHMCRRWVYPIGDTLKKSGRVHLKHCK